MHNENEKSLTLQSDNSSVMWVTDLYGQTLCNDLRVMTMHHENEKSLTVKSGFSKVVAGAGFARANPLQRPEGYDNASRKRKKPDC